MKLLEISSATNSQYKIFKSLLGSKGIKENKLFILSGEKLISEFLKNLPTKFNLEFVLFSDELKIETEAKKTRLSADLFKELDVLGTRFNLLVISFTDFDEKNFSLAPQALELIVPLGDPRNLGSLLRTAVGFGIKEITLTSEATHPYLQQSLKASAGAALNIKILKSKLKISEIPLIAENYALELHGTELSQVKWPADLRLWVGEEGPGLQLSAEQKRFMKFVNIKTEVVESLNATVSTSLALWEWSKNSR